MRRVLVGVAVLISGLLFYCPKAYAYDDILPEAGFTEFLDEIEVEPIEPQAEREPLPHYILTEEDKDLILRISVLEAGETDVEGIAHVQQVVLNRVFDEKFPSTVEGVIFQNKQFQPADKLAKANITPAAEEALDEVVKGNYLYDEALYFESLPGIAWEGIHTYLFSYGGHDFYK